MAAQAGWDNRADVSAHETDDQNLYNLNRPLSVDELNRGFYGHFPYPWRPFQFLFPADGTLMRRMIGQDIGEWSGSDLPEKPNIWIAGCGTNQAAQTALYFPSASVLGTDLSKPSLELCRGTLANLGLTTVVLRNESINEANYRDAFDYVISTGVIHHNSDPAATLRVLARAVKPTGLLELMVYNRYHRLSNTAVQKAVKLMEGSQHPNWDEQLGLLRQIMSAMPESSELGQRVAADFSEYPDSRVADSLLQPVEYSYTVESLGALAEECGLRLVAYRISEWDRAAHRTLWNLKWRNPAMQDRYNALPDATRWQISNLLLFDASPMLWFYLQRVDSPRSVKSETQIVAEFLDIPITRSGAAQRMYLLSGDQYRLSEKVVPFIGPAAGVARDVLNSISQSPTTVREILKRLRIEPDFETVAAIRVQLATSASPFLQPAA